MNEIDKREEIVYSVIYLFFYTNIAQHSYNDNKNDAIVLIPLCKNHKHVIYTYI